VPYEYDAELGGACRHWLRVRHSLLPYFYTAAHEFRETGIPLTRGLFLEEPNNPAAYRFDEYWCGSGLLIAPVLDLSDSRTLYLPEGDWWEFDTAKKLKGGREITRAVTVKDVPAYVPAGTILTRQNPDGDIHAVHISDLTLDVYPGADGVASLYEDDGTSDGYLTGKFCVTHFELEGMRLRGSIKKGVPLGATRRITIQIRLDKAPAKITFNKSTPLPCEGQDGIYTIALPEHPSDKPWELHVE
jgi:alpha-glucosidase